MTTDDRSNETRVLLAAPTLRDGEITVERLRKSGICCAACNELSQLADEITRGAGALLLTERSLLQPGFEQVNALLKNQPAWSDLPIVLLLRERSPPPLAARFIASMTNVMLLERPASIRSVVSAVETALRARNRQYQLRDQVAIIRGTQTRLAELQEQLEFALEASQLGTFHCSFPLDKIACNERCRQQYFLAPGSEVDFARFYAMVHPDDRERTRQAVEQSVTRGAPYDTEYRIVSPTGELRWMRATGRTFFDSGGKPLRFDGTTLDISEERARVEERQRLLEREQAARQQAEHASRMKDEFLATLSHELRTPLNAIFGWSRLLKMGYSDRKTVAKAIDVIDRNVRVQTQLIEDLLDMSRIISGKVRLEVQAIDIPEVLDAALEAIKPALDAKEIQLEKIVDPRVGAVNGDFGRLQQVLWNLLTNAAKFTEKGGRISVRAQRVHGQIEINVSDTGSGIDSDFLPHLFERFSQADGSTTRQHGGLGLGLSIAKQLVEMHGGSIRADSPGRGKGSTFSISLPPRSALSAGEHVSSPRPSSAFMEALQFAAGKLEGVKVLVVDDESDARDLIRRILTGCKAIPKLAATAAEAQACLAKFEADVIVSDIGMPQVDGYDFIRSVRERGLKTPAIALTAFARAEDRTRALESGFQAHLPKPIDPAELLAMIAKLSEALAPR